MSTTHEIKDHLPALSPVSGTTAYDLSKYRRIVILTEGHTNVSTAKTANGLLRFRGDDVVALLDSECPHRTASEALGHGGDIPIVSSLNEADSPDAMFIGISPAGGRLPAPMQSAIRQAVASGIDVISGLHDFLSSDSQLVAAAAESGSQLIDVRRIDERSTAKHPEFRKGCVRVHTVGHDCAVGKMFTSLEIERELLKRGLDAKFLATGQTGIMIAGNGVPIDSVVSDFVNGSMENLVLAFQQHDFLLIEGQGSIVHPAYSGVTAGLLHGCAPDGLILCYEGGRTTTKGLDHVPLKSLAELKTIYETIASARNPCQVIGVALNGRRLSADEATAEKEKVSAELGLPVYDVYRDGPQALADAVLELGKKVNP
ncbi:DUF1611 domain-containing protein [Bremerella alba]|uniref:DUF1611 domain-containing protein n=1 Tax=Bremerella alba TaxID=980252 RepID=A0A7V9A5P2_9BACT|nr:DUF1611 domain-containing protein [Bremerella alba]MBA2113570.1 hypothetical protein [Bremerella alba]